MNILHITGHLGGGIGTVICDWMKKKDKNGDAIDWIISFVKKHGGVDYATQVMNEYKNKSLEILALFPQNEANHSLSLLVEYAVTRDK